MRPPAVVLLALGLSVLVTGDGTGAEQPTGSGPYTKAQADAGRLAYTDTCGKCHGANLLGRVGDPGELPPLDSLPADYRRVLDEMVAGQVPPLAGEKFFSQWRGKTGAQFVARIINAGGAFPPYGKREDGLFLEVAAYLLQANGIAAGATPMTVEGGVVLEDGRASISTK